MQERTAVCFTKHLRSQRPIHPSDNPGREIGIILPAFGMRDAFQIRLGKPVQPLFESSNDKEHSTFGSSTAIIKFKNRVEKKKGVGPLEGKALSMTNILGNSWNCRARRVSQIFSSVKRRGQMIFLFPYLIACEII